MWCLAVFEQSSLAYNAHMHATADSDQSCCYAWFMYHDKTVNQQCAAHLAHPMMMNHPTS